MRNRVLGAARDWRVKLLLYVGLRLRDGGTVFDCDGSIHTNTCVGQNWWNYTLKKIDFCLPFSLMLSKIKIIRRETYVSWT